MRRHREGKSVNEMCIINQLLFWGTVLCPHRVTLGNSAEYTPRGDPQPCLRVLMGSCMRSWAIGKELLGDSQFFSALAA